MKKIVALSKLDNSKWYNKGGSLKKTYKLYNFICKNPPPPNTNYRNRTNEWYLGTGEKGGEQVW